MPIREAVKIALAKADMTLTDVVGILNECNEKKTTIQNVSKKIRTATLRYEDAEKIADALGYEIVWQKRSKPDV